MGSSSINWEGLSPKSKYIIDTMNEIRKKLDLVGKGLDVVQKNAQSTNHKVTTLSRSKEDGSGGGNYSNQPTLLPKKERNYWESPPVFLWEIPKNLWMDKAGLESESGFKSQLRIGAMMDYPLASKVDWINMGCPWVPKSAQKDTQCFEGGGLDHFSLTQTRPCVVKMSGDERPSPLWKDSNHSVYLLCSPLVQRITAWVKCTNPYANSFYSKCFGGNMVIKALRMYWTCNGRWPKSRFCCLAQPSSTDFSLYIHSIGAFFVYSGPILGSWLVGLWAVNSFGLDHLPLYSKLGSKSVEEYRKEMKMASFLHGELVHQTIKVEMQLRRRSVSRILIRGRDMEKEKVRSERIHKKGSEPFQGRKEIVVTPSTSAPRTNNIKCFKCLDKGHTTSQCPNS
ncbi:hypothetical protein CR513_11675, partial [Mucuna pruriens]